MVGFLDDADVHQGSRINGVPVIGRVSDWIRFQETEFVVAVGRHVILNVNSTLSQIV